MRLSAFIRNNIELILQDWENFAATLSPLTAAGKIQLRDHAKAMLLVICADLDTYQAVQDGIEKSWGNAPEVVGDTAAESHAIDRVNSGFSIEELMAEYRAMRASVLRLWQAEVKHANEFDLRDMLRFNEAIDQALTEAIARYSSLLRESQSVFMAILGHDVRNPLGAISMGGQLLLQDEQLPQRHVRVAKQIIWSMERVNEMVADLLDFSTTQLGGGMPVKPCEMDFAIECRSIVEELKMFHTGSRIELEIEGDLNVCWDRPRIRQALSNLVTNAIQHGEPGSAVWVTVLARGQDVVWAIQNDGKIMDAGEIRFMFEPGKRFAIKSVADRSASHTSNLGLGLYITRAIVEAHEGSIRVTSTEAEGTTFLITVPRGVPR